MIGRWWLLVILTAGVLVGCSSERDRQWYKPGGNYTIAEFKQDRDGCTQGNTLDEQCMKEKGWVPLTTDKPANIGPQPAGKNTIKGKY